jgi:hypothetical protein
MQGQKIKWQIFIRDKSISLNPTIIYLYVNYPILYICISLIESATMHFLTCLHAYILEKFTTGFSEESVKLPELTTKMTTTQTFVMYQLQEIKSTGTDIDPLTVNRFPSRIKGDDGQIHHRHHSLLCLRCQQQLIQGSRRRTQETPETCSRIFSS